MPTVTQVKSHKPAFTNLQLTILKLLLVLFFRNILNTKTDTSHFIFAKADNFHFITKCELVLYMIDAAICNI